MVAFSWEVARAGMFKITSLLTSGTWWLENCGTLSLSCGLSFFIWQLDPQSEKVEAGNPHKNIPSDAFYWLNQVTRSAQIKGEGNSLHLLMGGDGCAQF